MSAARYNTARSFEDQCEHAAQSSSDDGENRAMATEELISERLQETPQWAKDLFRVGRQEACRDDARSSSLPEWLREALLLASIPDLRTAARDCLTDEEISERADEIRQCQEDQ